MPAAPPSTPQPPVAPQYWLLVAGSTQDPPHATSPCGQLETHAPDEQSSRLPHAWPQLPQLAGSTFLSMQDEPQRVVPPPHDRAQAPVEHTSPPAHVVPQVPQLPGSSVVLTHDPEQEVSPEGQLDA